MNTEILQQILNELKIIKTDISTLKTDVSTLKEGQKNIKSKLDIIYEQTADLTEFRTEATAKLDNINTHVHKLSSDFTAVEVITGKNMQDIAHLKAIK